MNGTQKSTIQKSVINYVEASQMTKILQRISKLHTNIFIMVVNDFLQVMVNLAVYQLNWSAQPWNSVQL